ncbi:MAG TPA: HAD-IA family hydrolase [Alphaproteobacteria bacterium]|nr:HAD-IA family hydrolase [Alphaproteobacteria bacterium]
MSKRIRLVMFDCDGTLVDSQDMIHHSVAAAFTRHGRPAPDKEAVKRIVGLPLVGAMARLWPEASPEDCEAIGGYYKEAFQTLRAGGNVHEPLFPGVRETLATLEADGYLLGVATGKSRRGLDAALAAHGLADHFVTLHTSDGVPGKPHPQMVFDAMAATGAPADRTVVIGDTRFDMQMAKSAGAGAIGVAWGYHPPEQLRAAGADTIASEPAALTGEISERLGV